MRADCHIHMLLDGENWRGAIARHTAGPDIPWIRSVLDTYRSQGFTYLRDGGDRWGVGSTARALAPEYSITYRTPLAPLYKQGHYGSFIGRSFQDLREYTALVRQHRSRGADFIKIMISGLMDFNRFGHLTEPGLPPEQIRQLIHIAHSEGFAVMVHANGAPTVEAAAEAGADSVEHGAYLDEAALSAMARSGTVWVPTLSTVANLRGTGRFSEAAVAAIFTHTAENIRRFAALGGLLAPGSDAGAWAVPHGADTEHTLLADLLGPDSTQLLTRGTDALLRRF